MGGVEGLRTALGIRGVADRGVRGADALSWGRQSALDPMKTHTHQRPRPYRPCRGSAWGVGRRCGKKLGRMKDDGLPTVAETRALRKRLGLHSRQYRCGRPAPYRGRAKPGAEGEAAAPPEG